MLKRKSVERAAAAYVAHKDPEVLSRLAVFVPALAAAADCADKLAVEAPEWTQEAVEAARLGKAPLFTAGTVTIDAGRFLETVRTIAGVIADGRRGENLPVPEGETDWAPFATEELLKKAAVSPVEYIMTVAELGAGRGELFFEAELPALALAVRAFLDRAAEEGSRLIDKVETDTSHHNRPVTCPVCGAEASVAAVLETPRNGNVKYLYCHCCGAHWHFERIRCACCGDMAVSDLHYVHDEGDDKHRLHVCSSCHGATPTVFGVAEENLCPEVEAMVMRGLMACETEAEEEKKA